MLASKKTHGTDCKQGTESSPRRRWYTFVKSCTYMPAVIQLQMSEHMFDWCDMDDAEIELSGSICMCDLPATGCFGCAALFVTVRGTQNVRQISQCTEANYDDVGPSETPKTAAISCFKNSKLNSTEAMSKSVRICSTKSFLYHPSTIIFLHILRGNKTGVAWASRPKTPNMREIRWQRILLAIHRTLVCREAGFSTPRTFL